MKYCLFCIFFLFLFFRNVEAQLEQGIIPQERIELANSREPGNMLIVQQIQSSNVFTGIQYQQASLQNNIFAVQNGYNNAAYISQDGTGLDSYLYQSQSMNNVNIWLEGANSMVVARQDGAGNSINSYIENSLMDFRKAELTQNGNFNQINLALFDSGTGIVSDTQEVRIDQTGDNNGASVFLENVFTNITITQQAGVNGDGMKVNITNTYFAFPMK